MCTIYNTVCKEFILTLYCSLFRRIIPMAAVNAVSLFVVFLARVLLVSANDLSGIKVDGNKLMNHDGETVVLRVSKTDNMHCTYIFA